MISYRKGTKKSLRKITDVAEILLTKEDDLPPFLLHYTDMEHFFPGVFGEGILKTLCINFYEISKSNDLHERYLLSNFPLPFGDVSRRKDEIRKTSTASFCGGYYGLEGINHPRMWIQYANKHKGVCLEIDTKILIETNTFLKGNIFPIKYGIWELKEKDCTVDNLLRYKRRF
jgi:hypothetical protein